MRLAHQTMDSHGSIRVFDDDTVLKAAIRKCGKQAIVLTRLELEEAKHEDMIEDQTSDGGLRFTVSDNGGS